jgi:hypothetical protein
MYNIKAKNLLTNSIKEISLELRDIDSLPIETSKPLLKMVHQFIYTAFVSRIQYKDWFSYPEDFRPDIDISSLEKSKIANQELTFFEVYKFFKTTIPLIGLNQEDCDILNDLLISKTTGLSIKNLMGIESLVMLYNNYALIFTMIWFASLNVANYDEIEVQKIMGSPEKLTLSKYLGIFKFKRGK